MEIKEAIFRFYEELNDFLPIEKKKISFSYSFNGSIKIKDAISSLGVPCSMVDLILVNGKSVDFSYHLRNKDRISVYPVFETLDISDVTHLKNRPLRKSKFIVDMHLVGLERQLSRLGFNIIHKHSEREIVNTSLVEKRIILTKDKKILKYKNVTRCYLVKSNSPEKQLKEVLHNFSLYKKIQANESP